MHLEDIRLPGIERGKAGECFIDCKYVCGGVFCAFDQIFDKRYLYLSISSFFCVMSAGVVHQDVAHGVGSEAQDAGTVLPHGIGLAGETQVCLVYESGWLEGMVAALEAHLAYGQSMQFPVETRGEARPGFRRGER